MSLSGSDTASTGLINLGVPTIPSLSDPLYEGDSTRSLSFKLTRMEKAETRKTMLSVKNKIFLIDPILRVT